MSSPRKLQVCFNCGTQLDSTNISVDHIPPKCLFDGYGVTHKTNRKTVPCCQTCNNGFSVIDKLFRNVIGFAFDNNDSNKEELIKKAVASLLKDRKIRRDSDGSISMTIPEAAMTQFLTRIFKAVYFDTYNEVFPENDFDIKVINEHSPQAEITMALLIQQYIEKDGLTGVSGSKDIFQYVISRMNFDEVDVLRIANDINDSDFVGAKMIFNENYAAVVICSRKNSV